MRKICLALLFVFVLFPVGFSYAFEINLVRIEYYENVDPDKTLCPKGNILVREIYKAKDTAPNDIVSASYYPDDGTLKVRRLKDQYWGIDEEGLLVRSWCVKPDFKYNVKRIFLRLSDGATSNVIEFTIDVKNAEKKTKPQKSVSVIK